MKKTVDIDIKDDRRPPVREQIVSPLRKLNQDKFAKPGIFDDTRNLNPLELSEPGAPLDFTISKQAIACCLPANPIILSDPADVNETVDSWGANRVIYERLTRVGNEFVARLPVNFYRQVWFDGLEAYDPAHYDQDTDGHVVPNAVLIAGTVVTAMYVKR